MKYISILIIIMGIHLNARSSHVVGGDINLQYVSPNTYTLTVRVYKDCWAGSGSSPAGMPTSITVGLYDLFTDFQEDTWTISNPISDTLSLGDACYTPDGICVMEGVFSTQVTIPDNPNGYYLQTQLFARNGIIDNISAPGSTGMTFYAEIPDPAIGPNSTPDFGPYPTDGYLCVSYRKDFQFNVVDADGDQLVYSFVDPLNAAGNGTTAGPYNSVNWLAPYSLADICGGTPPMEIDAATGVVSAQPSAVGVYVFAVRVEEYRNGIKIGETRRDMQYAALNCTQDAPPEILQNPSDSVIFNPDVVNCVDIVSQDTDASDTIFLEITSDLLGDGAYLTTGTPLGSNMYNYGFYNPTTMVYDSIPLPTMNRDSNGLFYQEGMVATRFCWVPSCDDISPIPNVIDVQSYSLGCSGSDTTNFSVNMYVQPAYNELVKIPNVFTPNNDGVNEMFKIDGISEPCFDVMDVQIYNRWGQLVYESDDPNFEWDGTNLNGKDCPAGTFYVIINGIYASEDVSNDRVGNPGSRATSKYAINLFR